jgi:RNA polymerase sigma factor (TIGR02999 family)
MLTNLRAIARRLNKPASTLNTTALVHEAYLRLAGAGFEMNDREHFLALVARAMRQILIDHARAQRRLKRGGAEQVTLTDATALTEPQIEQLFAIEELLDALGREHPRRQRVFEMRFYAGVSVEEAAKALCVSENTVIRDYRLACAWLRYHFQGASSNGRTSGARLAGD